MLIKKVLDNSIFYGVFNALRTFLVLYGLFFAGATFTWIYVEIAVLSLIHIIAMSYFKPKSVFLLPVTCSVVMLVQGWDWASLILLAIGCIVIATLTYAEYTLKKFRYFSYGISIILMLWLIWIMPKPTTMNLEAARACVSDSECIAVQEGSCGCSASGKNTAINRQYYDQYMKYNSYKYESMFCAAMISKDPSCFGTLVCQQGVCTIAAKAQ